MKELLRKKAKVYIACRDEAKARAAIDHLEKETGHRAKSLKLDLADLASVEECAKEFLRYGSAHYLSSVFLMIGV